MMPPPSREFRDLETRASRRPAPAARRPRRAPAPARAPGLGSGACRSGRHRRPDRRLPAAAPGPDGRAGSHGRRRVDRRGEVHDSQQPRRRGGQPIGRAPTHDARARSRLPPRRRALVRGRPDPARPAESDGRRPDARHAPGRAGAGAPTGSRASRLAGHRLRARREPRAGDAAPRSRRRLALRDHGSALRGRRAVGVPRNGARAGHGALDRAQPASRTTPSTR